MTIDAALVARALAATPAPRAYAHPSRCGLCGAQWFSRDHSRRLQTPAAHKPSCPWRLARELLDDTPLSVRDQRGTPGAA